MNKTTISVLIVVAIVAILGLSFYGYFNNVRNTCIRFENEMTAVWQEMQNIDGKIVNKLKSHGKVIENYSDTLIEAIQENVKRYAYDKNLLFKMVTESANVTPNSDLWLKLQDAIDASYDEFAMAQKDKIDRARVYKNYLQEGFVRSGIIKNLGFPSEEAEKIMNMVIVSNETKKTFDTGIKDATDPFGE